MDVNKDKTNLITIKLCSECGCLSYYDWILEKFICSKCSQEELFNVNK
jgi:hypothetical protein